MWFFIYGNNGVTMLWSSVTMLPCWCPSPLLMCLQRYAIVSWAAQYHSVVPCAEHNLEIMLSGKSVKAVSRKRLSATLF